MYMKEIILTTLICLFYCAISYFLISFYYLNINSGYWSEIGRLIFLSSIVYNLWPAYITTSYLLDE